MMSDWASGYVTDIEYTYGYYPELNPLRARLALLKTGLVAPQVRTACELAFGQGLAINFHAAASPTNWWGTDFSPSQTKFAQECAAAAQTDVHLYDEAFSDFCTRRDLPDFDYIALHGIWSWITLDNRAVIVDFIRRKLKVGGVLYISYNTMPGWAVFAPMQHLLLEHAQVMAARGRGVMSRFDAALEFAEQMLATNSRYGLANPQVQHRLQKIKEVDRTYATHEYLCEEWRPLPIADMARWLEPAKVSYACSAHYLDHVDALNLTPEQQALLADIPDPIFRETTRDFMVNAQFRRDYWIKGPRRLSMLEQVETLRRYRVTLTQPRSSVSLKVTGALAQASLHEAVYAPILDALADHQPRTIAQLEQMTKPANVTLGQLVEAVMVLTGSGAVQPAQDAEISRKAKPYTDRLNTHLIGLARASGEIGQLASPVMGGGVNVNRLEQLFLLSRAQGRRQPGEWAQAAWQLLSAQGQRVRKNDKALESAEENVAELTRQAEAFDEKRLPILKALEIA
jgi:SAM-dependent methyltransferase